MNIEFEPYAEDPRLTAAVKEHRDRCRTATKLSDFDDAHQELVDTIMGIENGK